jgi:hypothetical protein
MLTCCPRDAVQGLTILFFASQNSRSEEEGRSDGKPWWVVEIAEEARTFAAEEKERLENKIAARVLSDEERARCNISYLAIVITIKKVFELNGSAAYSA